MVPIKYLPGGGRRLWCLGGVGARASSACRAVPGVLRSGFKFALWELDLTSGEAYAVSTSKG
jgi:hypothetical protein